MIAYNLLRSNKNSLSFNFYTIAKPTAQKRWNCWINSLSRNKQGEKIMQYKPDLVTISAKLPGNLSIMKGHLLFLVLSEHLRYLRVSQKCLTRKWQQNRYI